MKQQYKIAITLLFLLICQQSISQVIIPKGTSLAGASASFFRTNTENTALNPLTQPNNVFESTNSRMAFRPSFARALEDDFMLGGSLILQNNTTKQTSIDQTRNSINKQKTVDLGFSIFVRKYYQLKGNFGAFIQPEVATSWGRTKRSFEDEISGDFEDLNEFNTRSHSVGLGLGLYYGFNEKFLIETSIGNLSVSSFSSKQKDDRDNDGILNETKNSSVTFNFINTISFDRVLTVNYLF